MYEISDVLKKVRRVHADEGVTGLAVRVKQKIDGITRKTKLRHELIEWKNEVPAYYQLEERSAFRPDKEKIKSLQNKHKGQRCFIVGNGPSLNKMDLSKIKNEFTFGVNGIFYKTRENGFLPYYYVVEDSHVMKDNLAEINNYKVRGQKFFPTDYKELVTDSSQATFFNMNRGFYEKNSPKYRVPHFSVDCAERIYCGQSVTIINLQLAYYMGFEEVYLIGMDFSYNIPSTAIVEGCSITSTDDDPNHFHPDYFGKGKKWHDPQLDKVLMNYKMTKLIFECANRKIYNATVGGQLEVFERVNYEAIFY